MKTFIFDYQLFALLTSYDDMDPPPEAENFTTKLILSKKTLYKGGPQIDIQMQVLHYIQCKSQLPDMIFGNVAYPSDP